MNKEQDQRFLNQIEKVLLDYEDPYVEGAWEDFDKARTKSKSKWFIYVWTAAAVALICLGFGLYEFGFNTKPTNQVVLSKPQPATVETEGSNLPLTNSSPPITDLPSTLVEKSLVRIAKAVKKGSSIPVLPINRLGADSMVSNVVASVEKAEAIASEKSANQTIVESLVKESAEVAKTQSYLPKAGSVTVGAYDSLMNKKTEVLAKETKSNKLRYSLVVAPALTQEKVNLGGGMELSYPINEHLSLSSGVLYSAFEAKSNGSSLVSSSRRATGATLAVSGIEIPVGIQYQAKGGFFANVGVSALGLLHNRLEYGYVEEFSMSATELKAGSNTNDYLVVAEPQQAKSMESINNYMGFFNLSTGKKQSIGNVNLHVGPFLKIPFNSVSTEKINLWQGGIRLGFDF